MRSTVIRPLEEDDIPVVLSLCCRAFGEDHEMFRRILAAGWDSSRSDHGAVLVDNEEIVGFATALYARRAIDGKEHRLCALGPWYVQPQFRVKSLALLSYILDQKKYSYTSHSPNDISVRVLKRFGFQELSTHWRIFAPLMHCHTLLRQGGKVVVDQDEVYRMLDDHGKRLFSDHAKHGCCNVGILNGREFAHVITKRRTLRSVPVSELLYVSNTDLVGRYFEQVKWAIMKVDRTCLVMSDPRLLGANAPRGLLRRQRVRMFRAEGLPPEKLDNLYSEVAVM